MRISAWVRKHLDWDSVLKSALLDAMARALCSVLNSAQLAIQVPGPLLTFETLQKFLVCLEMAKLPTYPSALKQPNPASSNARSKSFVAHMMKAKSSRLVEPADAVCMKS